MQATLEISTSEEKNDEAIVRENVVFRGTFKEIRTKNKINKIK